MNEPIERRGQHHTRTARMHPRQMKRLVQDELIGLAVTLTAASDPFFVGCSGVIIDETRKTILLRVASGREYRVQKHGLAITIHYQNKTITILGDHIRYRPEDRIKRFNRKWQRAIEQN